jgi:hypothetical protein
MRNNITILILVLLVGCSPKNPYYGMYGAFHPYQSFFDNSQQKTYYDIEGNNKLGQILSNASCPIVLAEDLRPVNASSK